MNSVENTDTITDDRVDSAPSSQGADYSDRIPVLEARDVHLHFDGVDTNGSPITIRALDGVDFKLYQGQICALVGESGSGKSTIARVFSLIYRPTSGEIFYQGEPINVHGGKAERRYYSNVQMIYQDPFNSLNGLKKIGTIVSRIVKIHNPKLSKKEIAEFTRDRLRKVNLTPQDRYIDRYPTDLSGGQRQRVAIARALAVRPNVILADEPTSMLDASIRLDVLNLLGDLRKEENLAILYITHDIASARYLSDRIHVMYGGKIVEEGPTEDLINASVHPYTKLLLGAAPDPDRYKGSEALEKPHVTDVKPVDNTTEMIGCRFAPRCPFARRECTEEPLPTFVNSKDNHEVRCWEAQELPDYTLQR